MAAPAHRHVPPSSAEALGIIGFSCFFAWYLFVFFGAFVYFPDHVGHAPRLALQAFGFVLIYALSRILYARGTRIVELSCTVPFLSAACACGLAAPAYFIVSGFTDLALWIGALCTVPSAFCAMSFLISWEDACGRISGCNCLRFMCFSLGGGIVAYLLLRNLCAGNAAWAFAAVLVVLSAAALYCMQDSYSADEAPLADAKARPGLDRRIAVLGFTVNAAFGLAWASFTSAPTFSLNILFGVSSLAVLFVSYLLFNATFKMKNTISLFMRISVAGMAVGLVAPALVDPQARAVCYSFAIAVWFMYWASVDTLLVQHARNIGVAAAAYLAPSKTACNAGFACGWLAGLGAYALGSWGIDASWVSAGAGLVALVATLCFIPFMQVARADEKGAGAADGDEPPQSIRLAQATKLYGLTRREGEVLGYLLDGRGAQAIADKLVLSEHTVRTHIYNVYKKADVHSRQELAEHVDALGYDPLGES